MKSYVLFFNASELEPSDGVSFSNEWIVGELEGGYVRADLIDSDVDVLSHHDNLPEAMEALLALFIGHRVVTFQQRES